MSSFIVEKADIDALVSIAVSWTEDNLLRGLPPTVRQALTVTPQTADEVGTRLWAANHDANNFGGPKELADPEWLASEEAMERFQPLPDYVFDRLPGKPTPSVALHLIGFYDYQTAGDAWEDDAYWRDGHPPFEVAFALSMRGLALAMLDAIPRAVLSQLDSVGSEDIYGLRVQYAEAEDAHGTYEQELPWGLTNDDRDLFLRYLA